MDIDQHQLDGFEIGIMIERASKSSLQVNLPLAIRQDHNPFFLAWLYPGFAKFLVLLRWASYKCPNCSGVFRRDYWPENVRIGCGRRNCAHCGSQFDDGSREWPELTRGKKLRYFLPPGMQAIAGGGVFCATFTLLILPKDVINLGAGILLFTVFLSPVLVWSLLRLQCVFGSIRRYG